jgi:hypothetical protein
MRRMIAFAAVLVLLAGCNGESNPTGTNGPVAFSTVYKSKTSAVTTRRGEIVSRESRWVEVWDEITAGQSPKPALPLVNFENVILIYAAGGELAEMCSDVKVDAVNRVDGSLAITIVEERRPTTCVCPAIVLRPVHVVSVPRAATGATFEFRITNVSGCP